MSPQVGDNVDVVFIQGTTVIFKKTGDIRSVIGDDVEVDVGQPDALKAKVSDLSYVSPNEWKLRLQISISD